MRKLFLLLLLIATGFTVMAVPVAQVQYFDLQDVRLLDSPFKHAQEMDKQYLLEMSADRLMAPFLREAGLTPRSESYTNWENTGLDGHIGGHYVSALALMYASTGDHEIKSRLDYTLAELKRAQDANGNGYIGGVPGGRAIWDEVANGDIRAGGFSLNGKWVPLYNIHKTYAGLRDAYLFAGSEDAKEMLIKMTDWAIALVSKLSDDQLQDMLRSEHGGLNETFADVAVITGDEKYLKLARQFSQHAILDPLLKKEDRLTGMHANTQIPKVLGFKRIADAEGNQSWSEAARFFWETVVKNRSVSIGGNSVAEHFNPVHDFSRLINHIEGPETCNTYNMLRLTRMLYQTSPSADYIDYYERALFNHILSTQNPDNGGLVYFTQMRPGHYRVYSQPHTSMWCCVGSGIENHAKYGEMIYAYTDQELIVNLFIPSKVNWKEKNVELIQENNFPEEAKTAFVINPKKRTAFSLKVRYPKWVSDNNLSVTVNGVKQPVVLDGNGYIEINRKWKRGDRVEIDLPMQLKAEQMPDKSNYFSFLYGPIVLASKVSIENMKGLYADDSRGGHVAHGAQLSLKDMPVLVGEPDKLVDHITAVPGKPFTFKLSSLISEKYPESMELIPFYKLHDSRYIIYWAQTTPSELKKMQEEIERAELERAKLDAITVDRVVAGQQQPESDHFIKFEDSETGFTDDIHWREGRGWFSYQMNNRNKKAARIQVKFYNRSWERKGDILVNGEKIATLSVKDGNNEEILIKEFNLPSDLQKAERLEIRFEAHPEFIIPRIVEVRLLEK